MQIIIGRRTLKHREVPVKFITLTNSVFWLEFSLITWQKLFIAILVKASSLE